MYIAVLKSIEAEQGPPAVKLTCLSIHLLVCLCKSHSKIAPESLPRPIPTVAKIPVRNAEKVWDFA